MTEITNAVFLDFLRISLLVVAGTSYLTTNKGADQLYERMDEKENKRHPFANSGIETGTGARRHQSPKWEKRTAKAQIIFGMVIAFSIPAIGISGIFSDGPFAVVWLILTILIVISWVFLFVSVAGLVIVNVSSGRKTDALAGAKPKKNPNNE